MERSLWSLSAVGKANDDSDRLKNGLMMTQTKLLKISHHYHFWS